MNKQTQTLSFRIGLKQKKTLDTIASILDRDRSYVINEAISSYLEFYKLEEQEMKARMKRAEAGDIATDNEVKAAFAKWKR